MALHVRQSRFMHYNAGAFVSRDEAVLLDPGILPSEIHALVAELGGAEVRTVVLTHSDWDHILGPEHLQEPRIVAHSSYEASLDPPGIRVVLSQLEEAAGVEREVAFEPPLPEETFDDELELRVGDLTLRLKHAPGHTPDMLTAFEPDSGTLWAADVLSDVEIPLVCHDLGDYERTLEQIGGMPIRVLVPGHGSPANDPPEIRKRIEEDRRYLDELRTTVGRSVAAQRSLEETVDACTRLPPRRSAEDESIHRLNVEKVYVDLGGDADPDTVGYIRAWKDATRR